MGTYEGQKISYEVSYYTKDGNIFSYITGDYSFFSTNVNIGSPNVAGLIEVRTGVDSHIRLFHNEKGNNNGFDSEINFKGGAGILDIGKNNNINNTLVDAISLGEGLQVGTDNSSYYNNNYLILGKFNNPVSYSLLSIGWGTANNDRKNLLDITPEISVLRTKNFGIVDLNHNELFGVFERSLEGSTKEILNSRIPFVMSDNKPIYYSYAYRNLHIPEGNANSIYTNSAKRTIDDDKGVITNIRFGGPNNTEVGITYTRTDLYTDFGYVAKARYGNSEDYGLGATIWPIYKLPDKYNSEEEDYMGYAFVTGIKQESNGRISYTYSLIYTPRVTFGNTYFVGNATNNSDDYGAYHRKDFIVKQGVYDHEIWNSYGSFTNNPSYYGDTNKTGVYDGILKNVAIDGDGKLSYTFKDISVNSGIERSITISSSNGNTTPAIEITDDRDLGDRFITNISQDKDGKISYTYQDFFTYQLSTSGHTNSGDGGLFINSIWVNDHVISYNFGSIISANAEGSYFINGIHYDGKKNLTYSYFQFWNQAYYYTNKKGELESSNIEKKGVLINTNLNTGGRLSYEVKDLTVNIGTVETINISGANDKAVEITDDKNIGERVITNISQDKYGQITYTYQDYYTPQLTTKISEDGNIKLKEEETFSYQYKVSVIDHEITYHTYTHTLPDKDTNYTYHSLSIDNHTSNNTEYSYFKQKAIEKISVINHIQTTNDDYENKTSNNGGNWKNKASLNHKISYTTVDVLTEYGFEKRFAETLKELDILTFAGTYQFIGGTDANGYKTVGQFNRSSNVADVDVYQCGYCFVVEGPGIFMGSSVPVNGGDFIILKNDVNIEPYSNLNNLSLWRIIDRNFDFRQQSTYQTNKVITNISIHEDGMLTYSYYDLTVTGGTDEGSERTKENNDVGLSSKISGKSIRVLNNISQSASGQITYTYTDIYNKTQLYNDNNAWQNYQFTYETHLSYGEGDDSTYTLVNTYVSWWGSEIL